MEKRAPGYRDEILPGYVGIIIQTVVGICMFHAGDTWV